MVADEIRRLSENTADQSKTIGGELRSVQETISEVVNASGVSEATFAKVASQIVAIDSLVREVSLGMKEQGSASSEILETMATMVGLAEAMGETANRSSSLVVSTLSTIGALEEAIDRFKV